MALTMQDLNDIHDRCQRDHDMKMRHAMRGNDWVVDSHSLSCTKLAELVALAKLGHPIWMRPESQPNSPMAQLVAQFAAQTLTSEMSADEYKAADFETAYEGMVVAARASLLKGEPPS